MGIMIAVGMKRYRLISLIATELIFICIIGLLSGIIVSIPILYYYHLNPITFSGEMAEVYKAFGMEPIMPVEWSTGYIINQAITIGIIAIVVLLYPIFYLYKFDIIKALKR